LHDAKDPYFDRFCKSDFSSSPSSKLQPFLQAALQIAKIEQFTGCVRVIIHLISFLVYFRNERTDSHHMKNLLRNSKIKPNSLVSPSLYFVLFLFFMDTTEEIFECGGDFDAPSSLSNYSNSFSEVRMIIFCFRFFIQTYLGGEK